MKKPLTLLALLIWAFTFTAPSAFASDCAGKDKGTTEVVITNEYTEKTGDYTMKKEKTMKKSWATMDMIKMKLWMLSVGQLQTVSDKMQDYKMKIPTDHPKYYVFAQIETIINWLIGTATASWDIVDVAVSNGGFPTLIAAVQAAGLVDTLKSEWPFTVFAPTEDAFASLLATLGVSAEELLADAELLTTVLTYHVVPGLYQASDVVGLPGATEFATVQWSTVTINPNGWAPMINDANIIATDVFATNWIIHVIDEVILP